MDNAVIARRLVDPHAASRKTRYQRQRVAANLSNSLKRILAQDDTIIFVGSGISRWSGLPSWEGLVGELADYLDDNSIDSALVRQEAEVGDLLQAASYGFLKLTPPQVAAFMRSACRSGSAAPGEIHQAIMMLGPSCFITTNYDDLLEQAYRQHRPAPSELRIVLNTQLFEQAEIIHAQARQFIFKPHGDARNADSIILTREQYRMLLPEGSLSATLNTFKTLLQSRPVLFVGFGLRDPDFLHLRDLLANIYRGGMRDHYAIVSDPVRDQQDYWRAHYGIHLIGYATADHGRDHSGLLALLEQLRTMPAPHALRPTFDIEDPAGILSLARYAASSLLPSDSEPFVIRVSRVDTTHSAGKWPNAYDHWPVQRLLREGPKQFILLGEPGSGKSFAMREAVNTLATDLQDACLCGKVHVAMRIPIAIDLKLYNGDLEGLISGKFPLGLSLDLLHVSFPIILYLDGYNEVPRSFREDGSFDRQLDALLEARSGLGLVIGSRTGDGLERLGLPVYRLSEISLEEVEHRLSASQSMLRTTYREDIIRILQRPFYFRLLNRAVMSLEKVHTPNDLYAQFSSSVAKRFAEAFGNRINIIAAMQRHAYATLERGSEAFDVSDLEAAIATVAPRHTGAQIEQIANWLASEEVIIPMQGKRAAFVHQSITEFLAACELKIKLEKQSGNVGELINLRRWDNAIFLTLGMLDEALAVTLLNEIVARDAGFALNAVRYVQHGGEALVGQILEIVAKLPHYALDHHTKFAFDRLPFAPSHEQALRRILLLPALRGEAFGGLAKALGRSVKQEIIDCLFKEGGFWITRGIGRALAHLVEVGDLSMLVERLACADPASLDDDQGITHYQVAAVATAVRNFTTEEIRRETLARLNMFDAGGKRIVAALICEIFEGNKSAEGLAMVIEVARLRLPKNLFAVYLIVRFESDLRHMFSNALDDSLFDTILNYIDHGDRWSVDLLDACAEEDVVRGRVLAEAEKSSGARRSIFEYCATRGTISLFAGLESLLQGGAEEELRFLRLIDFPDLDWSGRHDLLIAALALHNLEVARLVLGGSSPPSFAGLESIDLGEVGPWLNWLIQLTEDQSAADGAGWVAMQLAVLIARSSAQDNKAQLLRLLDQGAPAQQRVIATMVLHHMEGLLISDFSPQALDVLKSLVLRGQGGNEVFPHVFGLVADEAFIRDELFPLAVQSKKGYNAVASIAQQAGRRLGIRIAMPS
ncbi:SIR2 family NAD-dependent protein deacylase [Dyella flagellata]|uniref:SIR2 family NAD-dependent protein deacylase n=1 Tax=Dyella flagellata TaxID=1867833 RepID=UPI0024E14C14|nr:SIR2 family protein [Dyella flagellata]